MVENTGIKRASFMSDSSVIWQNKIVGYGEEDPEQLLANDLNWRTHPMFQRKVVEGSLKTVGWIQDVIVNKRTREEWDIAGGRFEETVIDGHLRVLLAMNASQAKVPVKYVDLTPDEEYLALQILDPSAALAHADSEKLEELRSMTSSAVLTDDAVKELLDKLAETHGFLSDPEALDLNSDVADSFKDGYDDEETHSLSCPKCGFRFSVPK